jgi:hypothetical protein
VYTIEPMSTESILRQKYLMPIGAILFGILIFLVFAETGLRLYVKYVLTAQPTEVKFDPPEILNSMGFRDVDHTLEKPARTYRIVGLGDSFVYGGGTVFQHTCLKHLEFLLRSRFKDFNFETIILSRSGANTVNEEDFLDRLGIKYDPDCVILGFCLNDPEYKINSELEARAHIRSLQRSPFQKPATIFEYFQIVQFIQYRLANTRANTAYDQYFIDLFNDDYIGWQACKSALSNISQLCRANDIPFMLVIFPVFSNDMDRRYPFTELHKKIDMVATSLNIDVLDLLPIYHGFSHRELSITATDSHPNEKGHMMAGRAIYEKMLRDDYLLDLGGK